jgi:hypothetical protein
VKYLTEIVQALIAYAQSYFIDRDSKERCSFFLKPQQSAVFDESSVSFSAEGAAGLTPKEERNFLNGKLGTAKVLSHMAERLTDYSFALWNKTKWH